MKKLIWIAVLGLVLIGCKAKSAPQASPATPAAAATRPISTPTTTVRAEDEYHAVTAVYESSKTQEGATDFFFSNRRRGDDKVSLLGPDRRGALDRAARSPGR